MRSTYAARGATVPTLNTTPALARLILAADRAGLPADVVAELWHLHTLTPPGQREAIARWQYAART